MTDDIKIRLETAQRNLIQTDLDLLWKYQPDTTGELQNSKPWFEGLLMDTVHGKITDEQMAETIEAWLEKVRVAKEKMINDNIGDFFP